MYFSLLLTRNGMWPAANPVMSPSNDHHELWAEKVLSPLSWFLSGSFCLFCFVFSAAGGRLRNETASKREILWKDTSWILSTISHTGAANPEEGSISDAWDSYQQNTNTNQSWGWAWCHTLLILALRKQRKARVCEFQASRDSTVRPCPPQNTSAGSDVEKLEPSPKVSMVLHFRKQHVLCQT